MEKEGFVSLWLGNVVSDEFLEGYTELKYNIDGECEPSIFLQDYKIDIDDIDEDFIECIFKDEMIDDINKLLEGCSYEEIILPRFNKIILHKNGSYNVAILLYNFQYTGKVENVQKKYCKFKYVGTVKYE